MNAPLPHNDPDLKLARQLAVSTGGPFSGEDARLMQLLSQYKEAVSVQTAPDSHTWQHIINLTNPGKSRVYQLKPTRELVWRWAFSALIVISATLGIFRFTHRIDDQPLAAASDAINIFEKGDGTVIALRPNSSIHAVEKTTSGEKFRLEGEAWFNVAKTGLRFDVITSAGEIQVLGTRFNVRTWGSATTVYLESGSVALVHATSGQRRVVQPGYTATFRDDGSITISEADADRSTGWLNGELVLKSTPFDEIRQELEHHYRIRIQIPETMLRETFSGRVLLGDPVKTLRDIGIVTGGTFNETAPRSYAYESVH